MANQQSQGRNLVFGPMDTNLIGALNTDSKDMIAVPLASKDPKLKMMMEKLSNIGEMDPPPGFNLEDAGRISPKQDP